MIADTMRIACAALLACALGAPPASAAGSEVASAIDPAVQQLSAQQIALALRMRQTSTDPLIVALARSVEASHRHLLYRLQPGARHAALLAVDPPSDRDYVAQLLSAHRELLERIEHDRTASTLDGADRIVGVLRSRIAMARAMQRELDARDRNFYTALESTD